METRGKNLRGTDGGARWTRSGEVAGQRSWRGATLASLLAATVVTLGVTVGACNDGNVAGNVDAQAIQTDGSITLDLGGVYDAGEPDMDMGPADVAPDTATDTATDTGADISSPADLPAADPGPPPGCTEDQCDIDGTCFDNEAPNPDNPCEVCLVAADREAWTPNDAAGAAGAAPAGPDGAGEAQPPACDDGDACTTGDRCQDGVCVGDAVPCDDANPCTDDACDPGTGACVFTPNEAPCVSEDLCADAVCQDGACVPGMEVRDCDDANPCTTDSCDPATGCVHAPDDDAACDDGLACTQGDACLGGACVGTPADCDDQDVCTVDACVEPGADADLADGGCVHHSLAALCADDNPCTDESCDPQQGCVFPFNTIACDDGNPCTVDDTCTDGACLGVPLDVDDGNECTDDGCDPANGEVHVFNTLACEDGDACTVGDVCSDGVCTSGPDPLDCDDDNQCTTDSCDPQAGCVQTPTTDACDDGDACTQGDTCHDSQCVGNAVDCDDGNACTADSCDPADGCHNDLIVSGTCRPNIVVTYPPRGATIAGDPANPVVTVTGTVTSGAGPITSFTINGVDVPVADDGSFSYDLPAAVGGNTIKFLATDSFDTPRERVQAFLWSKTYLKPDITAPKSGMVDPGAAIWLAQEVLDDGDHTPPPDDFATIFEMVLGNLDLGSMFDSSTPITSSAGYDIYLTGLTQGGTAVSLTAIDGGLRMNATISNVVGDLTFDCTCSGLGCGCWWAGGDSDGGVSIDSLDVTADILLSVNPDHTLNVNITSATTTINGLNIWSNNGWTNFLISVVEVFIKNSLVSTFEDQINQQLTTVLGPMLADALSALAFNTSFDIPKLDGSGDAITVSLVTDFSYTDFAPGGGALGLRAGGYSVKGTSFDNLGVPMRINCGAGAQVLVVPKAAPFEISLADDTLNELLYAAWNGGLLEFPVPESMLGGVDLTQYGITNLSLDLAGMLAPTASDCNAQGELLAHIGDLRVNAHLELFGQPMDIVIYATLTAVLELTAADGEIGVSLSEIRSLDTDVTVQQDDMVASEGVIKDLIETQLIGGLLGALGGGSLASIPLPEMDLSDAVGLPAGSAVIAIAPQSVTRQGGNTIISGTLQQ